MELTMGRVGAKHFHEQAAPGDFFDGLFDPFFFDMAFHIHEKYVLPRFPSRRPRLDLGHAQSVRGKGAQQVIQRTHFVLDREHQGGLVLAGALRRLLRQDEKPREVVQIVFDPRFDDLQAVELRANSEAIAAMDGSSRHISAARAVLATSDTGTWGMFVSNQLRHWAIAWGWEQIFFTSSAAPDFDMR